jgi:hypothetical protein
MLLNVHHFSYFTIRSGIILLSFNIGYKIFCSVFHLHGLFICYFYDFNCRFVCCKVSGAEIYAPQVYRLKIIGEGWGIFFLCIAIIFCYSFLRYDKNKKTKRTNNMAFHGSDGPNMVIVRFIMDNVWSVGRLEAYITSYYPDGVPLHTLRYALGRNRVPLHQYSNTLVKFATVLLALGHVRTPASILLELFLFRAITPLTQAEVGLFLSFLSFWL